jgi:hypothetical protein
LKKLSIVGRAQFKFHSLGDLLNTSIATLDWFVWLAKAPSPRLEPKRAGN